jgi:hypothetical protein
MLFHLKDMNAQFKRTSKTAMNPFIIAKMDLEAIRSFRFPPVMKEENPYF